MAEHDQDTLDTMEDFKNFKQLEGKILEKFDEIKTSVVKAEEQLKSQGSVNDDVKGEIKKQREDYDKLFDRLEVVEQKHNFNGGNSKDISLGEKFTDCDSFKSFQKGSTTKARLEVKTAIINATGQNQPLVAADRLPGIAATPDRILTIRDLLPSSTTDSNLVEFTREASFTNNAGPQVGGSPEQFENVTKPESGITFVLVNEPVQTIAHFIPASKQVLSDSGGLQGHINNRLMYGLKLKEEQLLLSGSGSNGELNGLSTQATAYAQSFSPNTTNKLDIFRDAMRQAHVAEYRPDFCVLNPLDWFLIETKKVGASDDRYVVGNPNAGLMSSILWGLPVVVTNSQAAGTFLMGSSMAAEIKDRQQAAVEMSEHDGTNFQKNMVTLRAEMRETLCVYRTEAFIQGAI